MKTTLRLLIKIQICYVSRHRTLMNLFNKSPVVDKDAFVAPSASVIGMFRGDEDHPYGMGASFEYIEIDQAVAFSAAFTTFLDSLAYPSFAEKTSDNVLRKKFARPDEEYDSMLGINCETPPELVLPDNIILPDNSQKAVQYELQVAVLLPLVFALLKSHTKRNSSVWTL
ncbi:Gamma carbonic anhydrase 1, mitochondrial [Sesamum alatum]|uniref:Gamma carbonic anhydrase 1, mitochondrial n=1 Tax=Sesamum alatum TaxID=300844 RepID=A0AAE1YQJ7_9LAMI|nr:Gamma carbonic anhydrase 1, mitochondrial [Sesamum alatum]